MPTSTRLGVFVLLLGWGGRISWEAAAIVQERRQKAEGSEKGRERKRAEMRGPSKVEAAGFRS